VIVNALAGLGLITLVWLVFFVWVKAIWPWAYVHVFRKCPAPLRIQRLEHTMNTLRKYGWELSLYGIGGKRFGIGIFLGTPPVWTCETRSCGQQFKTKAEVIAHEKEMKHGDFAGTP
jgi:hypothetical protein